MLTKAKANKLRGLITRLNDCTKYAERPWNVTGRTPEQLQEDQEQARNILFGYIKELEEEYAALVSAARKEAGPDA